MVSKLAVDNMTGNIEDKSVLEALVRVFGEEMNPVSTKAQRKVKVPEGLDLDAWIGEEFLPLPDKVKESKKALTFSLILILP